MPPAAVGFGLATARLLSEGGARVLITGRDAARLNAAREQFGGNAMAVRSDVASTRDIDALADLVKAELGIINVLFANAGINGFAPFEATSEEPVHTCTPKPPSVRHITWSDGGFLWRTSTLWPAH